MAKKKSAKSGPRKKLTSERPLKNRPHDPEPLETSAKETEAPEVTSEEEEALPGTEGHKPKRVPRQKRLPGTEDPEIEELEAAAEQYASIRDQRMALTPQEKQLKDALLGLMKKNGKERYMRDGIEIKVVHESETVKVKLKRPIEEE
jgi:hypothetical protein